MYESNLSSSKDTRTVRVVRTETWKAAKQTAAAARATPQDTVQVYLHYMVLASTTRQSSTHAHDLMESWDRFTLGKFYFYQQTTRRSKRRKKTGSVPVR